MNYKLYSDVILLRDLPEEGLCVGDIGTVSIAILLQVWSLVTALSFLTWLAIRLLLRLCRKVIYESQLIAIARP
jgi:hypothetical protein